MTSKTLRPPLHNPQSRHLRLQYVARSCSLSSPIKQRLVDVTISPQQIKFFIFRFSLYQIPFWACHAISASVTVFFLWTILPLKQTQISRCFLGCEM
ncbi:hypothetical protein ACFX2I_023607 [Malus domestica]